MPGGRVRPPVGSLADEIRSELDSATNDSDIDVALLVLRQHQDELGPRFLTYAYLLILTATIEKNAKILTGDGFQVLDKRQLAVAARSRGLLSDAQLDDIDTDLDDLFELRNFVSHSYGSGLTEPKNPKLQAMLKRIKGIQIDWENQLIIDKQYLQHIAAKLEKAYGAIGHFVYS